MLKVMENFELQALRSEELRDEREKWFIAAREQQEQKEIRAEKADDELYDLATAVILATVAEVQEFQARLDTYDEATVKALMQNQEAIEAVEARMAEKIEHAYVMDDGRKVFKSEDGTWAIDSTGNRLDDSSDNIASIPQTKFTAEEFEADTLELNKLNIERQQTLEYQEKLDNARERSNSDDFTKEELDELDMELEADMPTAVKRQMPDYEPSQETDLKSDFSASAEFSLSELPQQVTKQNLAPVM